MKLLVVAAALAVPASVPVAAAQPTTAARTIMTPPAPGAGMPNGLPQGGPGCLPLIQQVEAERRHLRRSDGHTLDREPTAFSFYAVDRQVNGCREVTFLRGNRPVAAPGR